MIVHQAVGMADPMKAIIHLLQDPEKGKSIRIIPVNGVSPITPGSNMVEGSRVFYSQGSGHGQQRSFLRKMSKLKT
jgi:hypothetical protein